MSARGDDLLLKAAESARSGKPLRITIRELIGHWDARRRGYWKVEEIQKDLAAAGLATVPPFTEGWIDNTVSLVPLVGTSSNPGSVEPTERVLPMVVGEGPAADISLRVGSLPSANLGVRSVSPNDSLEKAQSLMLRYDYSQLAVMSGTRGLKGAVSWESIAQARLRDPGAPLRDAMAPSEIVRADDDLLAMIPRIVGAGFAFVEASDKQIVGIVTTSDLSQQFATLATPFFLLAEIERRLRRVFDRTFSTEELAEVLDPSDRERKIRSADDLTIGEYVRLVELPARWDRLGWALDRKVFLEALDEVRVVRNEVMHFSPDPLDDEQLRKLENFLKWIRRLDAEV
jgi:CBS domain-containing protein